MKTLTILLALTCCLSTRAHAKCEFSSKGELLRSEATRAKAWNWTWGSLYAVAAGVQFGIAAGSDDSDARLDFAIGGIKSAIGVAAVLVDPLRVESTANPCSDLVHRRFSSAAESEAAKRSWFPHVGAALLNIGGGLVVGLKDDRWADAAIQTLAGIAVAEIQIFTTPSRVRDRQHSAVSIVPSPSRDGMGLSLTGTF
jgi:hypothetical protein